MKVVHRILPVIAIALFLLVGTLSSAGVHAEASTGTWDGGIAVQKDANNGRDPFVAQSSNGNKIMVWIEVDPDVNYYVYFSMYTPTTDWSWPATLATGGTFSYPQVGMSDNGSAIVCWIGNLGEPHIYSLTYTPGIGWGDIFDHGKTDSTGWRELRLSMNGDGDALLVHESPSTSTRSVEMWTYNAGEGWETNPDVLETVPIADLLHGIYVTLSDSGRAAAIWQHIDGNYHVKASIRTPAGTWGLPVEVDIIDGMTNWLRIGIDDSTGEFLATYLKPVGSYTITYYSITEGGTWSTPSPVAGLNNTYSWSQTMVMNSEGTAIVVTTDRVDPTYSVNATMYVDGEWTPVESLATDLVGLYYPEVAMDELGRAVVTFTIQNDRVAAIYTPGDGWTDTIPIETNAAGTTYTVASLSMESDSVLVGYSAILSSYTIWASSYEFPDTTAPSLLVDQAMMSDTDRPFFEISGTTDPDAQVDVNGKPAAVSSSGEFSILVELSAGDNSLVVTATDDAGNNVTYTMTVTYDDPVPRLEEQIEDLQDEIDSQQGTIDELQEDLETANDDITSLGSTSLMFGVLGVIGLVVAIVALAMVFMRRKG